MGEYARGKNALGICERCAEKVLLKELRPDGYIKDLQVCADCYDPYHPQDRLPDVHDPVTLRDPTGDPDRTVANLTKTGWPLSVLKVPDRLMPLSVSVAINQHIPGVASTS